MNNNLEKNQQALESGWSEAQKLRSDLKTGVRDAESASVLKSWWRRVPIFSRRKTTSLVNRIIGLLLIWSVVVYILGVAGLWWSSNKVIEDNFSQQASDWVVKLDELGTPLYAANDKFLFQSIEEQVGRFPEVSYLRYYEAEKKYGDRRILIRKHESGKCPRIKLVYYRKVAN